MQHFDVIVVGGGLSGWIAVAHAAKHGLSVAVFEKASEFGGRARTIPPSTASAASNLGAHTVYRDGELSHVLRELGVDVRGGVPPVGGHGLIDGRVVSLPTSAGALAVSPLFSWRAKLEYARVMTAIKKLDPRRVEGMSFREWVEMNVDDAMVRTVMYRSARVATDCAEPETQAAGPVLRQLKLVLGGGNLYVDGGWAALVEGLRRRAEGYGVVGNAGRAVVRIRRSKHAATERTGEASFVVDLGDGGRSRRSGRLGSPAHDRLPVASRLGRDVARRVARRGAADHRRLPRSRVAAPSPSKFGICHGDRHPGPPQRPDQSRPGTGE